MASGIAAAGVQQFLGWGREHARCDGPPYLTGARARDLANLAAKPLAVRQLPPGLDCKVVCNSADELLDAAGPHEQVLCFLRHGQSTGNAAKVAAMREDEKCGGTAHEEAYRRSLEYVDARLTAIGEAQAVEARWQHIWCWRHQPTLIVCSPLTRAIQTAALLFERELMDGRARLVIRPELREFYPDNNENQGRTVPELRACRQLLALPCWEAVQAALSDDAVSEWREAWDSEWACAEGSWQLHVFDVHRLAGFWRWLRGQQERHVAVVCHWGAINNLLNLEPWADGLERHGDPARFPCGGLALRFNLRNCGWIAVVASPP